MAGRRFERSQCFDQKMWIIQVCLKYPRYGRVYPSDRYFWSYNGTGSTRCLNPTDIKRGVWLYIFLLKTNLRRVMASNVPVLISNSPTVLHGWLYGQRRWCQTLSHARWQMNVLNLWWKPREGGLDLLPWQRDVQAHCVAFLQTAWHLSTFANITHIDIEFCYDYIGQNCKNILCSVGILSNCSFPKNLSVFSVFVILLA